jgi:hypothetical protein
VLAGEASWDDVDDALVRHGDFLVRFVSEQEVQTNEVQRSWALAPAFLALADGRPLDLLELGPSGGLNLVWDRYAYRYSTGRWGEGALELAGEDRVPPPAALLTRRIEVARRRGVDRSPVDVTTERGARLLTAFVWADQTARIERLRRAIATVRASPPELIRGDYVETLPALLAERVEGAQLVVYETASTQYLDRAGHARLAEAMHDAGLVQPFTFLTTGTRPEVQGYVLRAVRWPEGTATDIVHLDFHGAWLEWRAAAT